MEGMPSILPVATLVTSSICLRRPSGKTYDRTCIQSLPITLLWSLRLQMWPPTVSWLCMCAISRMGRIEHHSGEKWPLPMGERTPSRIPFYSSLPFTSFIFRRCVPSRVIVQQSWLDGRMVSRGGKATRPGATSPVYPLCRSQIGTSHLVCNIVL